MTSIKLGTLIDKLSDLRERKRGLDEDRKEINKEYETVEHEIMDFMEINKLEKASGENATASYKIETYPQVDDKEKLTLWVVKENRYEFLQSRVNMGPVKEMLDADNLLPDGVTVFTKPKLSLRRKS